MKIVVFVVLLSSVILVRSTENIRISKQKCQEYNEMSKKNNICNDSPILDGIVQLKDYPFVGAIGYDADEDDTIMWGCSGTLISDQYVLTVAHCTTYGRTGSIAKYVRFGETALNSSNINAKTYNISELTRHPNYKSPIKYNDIALLKLDRPVNFTDYIRPACVYTGEDLPQYNIAGFSFRTEDYHTRSGGILLHENNIVVSKENCSQEYVPNRRLPNGVDFDIQFCMAEESTACVISSGAPILHKEEELRCMQSIAGITQLGKGCYRTPGLNVKISGYIDWIESIAFS